MVKREELRFRPDGDGYAWNLMSAEDTWPVRDGRQRRSRRGRLPLRYYVLLVLSIVFIAIGEAFNILDGPKVDVAACTGLAAGLLIATIVMARSIGKDRAAVETHR